jgi:hypothetical protein
MFEVEYPRVVLALELGEEKVSLVPLIPGTDVITSLKEGLKSFLQEDDFSYSFNGVSIQSEGESLAVLHFRINLIKEIQT